ncbi:MAG: hypothetical protein AB1547_05245 [Thermodesulfobacteriota bacterium]
MKKGMILYLKSDGRYPKELDDIDFVGLRRKLDVEAIRLSASEDDVADACWRMLTAGIQQISCIGATVSADQSKLELRGQPIRIFG